MSTASTSVQPAMKNPATASPEAMEAIQALIASIRQGDVPGSTLELVHLRASQINGCSFCVDSASRQAREAGETDERLVAVAAWRKAPHFTDAERAALALTEAATRLSDRHDPVPGEVWEDAARYYDERGLAAIIVTIATTDAFVELWRLRTKGSNANAKVRALRRPGRPASPPSPPPRAA
jgi:AhpD family alkylhydroperoxidase